MNLETILFVLLTLSLTVRAHLKQNRFAVSLLTSGDVRHWNPTAKEYEDPRATTVPKNAYFAEAMRLNGLSIKADDLLANRSLIPFVKARGLSVYIWGDKLNSVEVLGSLLRDGADGLIFDRIDKLLAHPVSAQLVAFDQPKAGSPNSMRFEPIIIVWVLVYHYLLIFLLIGE